MDFLFTLVFPGFTFLITRHGFPDLFLTEFNGILIFLKFENKLAASVSIQCTLVKFKIVLQFIWLTTIPNLFPSVLCHREVHTLTHLGNFNNKYKYTTVT